jgi:hypothetical protein
MTRLLACAVLALMLCCPAAGATSSRTAGVTSATTVTAGTTVTIGEPSQLTSSSAVLGGSVKPAGQPTSFYFQYGASNAYGEQTSPTPLGSGTQSTPVSVALTGLAAYTTYHYRLVAVNAAGTTDGHDRTFTTRKIPLTFNIAVTPKIGLFGSPFSVAGTLSGTGSADHAVVLEANPFPYLAGFKMISGDELTDAGGSFSFPVVGLSENTELRVATLDAQPVDSRTVVALVAVRVTLHLRPAGRHGFARLYGTVTPGEPGSRVIFQLLAPALEPVGVSSTFITGGGRASSRFSRIVRIRRAGLYRAFVSVASGAQVSGAQVSNHSRAILIR